MAPPQWEAIGQSKQVLVVRYYLPAQAGVLEERAPPEMVGFSLVMGYYGHMSNDSWTEFLGCKINLSKKPLTPRPETEFWVNEFIKSHQLQGPPLECKVLDIFTGSGCIGIAVAKQFPNAQVTLSDKTNYISTPLPKNAKFVKSDLFKNITGRFDFILANPPYVPEGAGVSGIMDREPHDALYAGKDGLDVIKPFLDQAYDHLNPTPLRQGFAGQVWLEFGSEQRDEIAKLIETNRNLLCRFYKDQYGNWRYVVISKQEALPVANRP